MPYIAWELVDHATIGTQEVLSRYYFVDTTGVGTPAGLNAAYQDVILPALANCQSNEVVHDSLTIRQVFPSLALGAIFPISPVVHGTLGAESTGTINTYSLQLVPGPTTDFTGAPAVPYIKRGGKHIAGVIHSSVNLDGSYNGDNDANLSAFGIVLIPPATPPYGCAIVTRVGGGVPTKLAFVSNYAIHGFGSQVSRKIGRGA